VTDGRVDGYFTATGIRPKFMEKIESEGIYISPSVFTPAQPRRKR
jgi:pilus assembly protein CpaF